VDFEHGLNNAVNRLRVALGDSARQPRFVETVPQGGYRFCGVVEVVELERPNSSPVPRPHAFARLAAAGLVAACLATLGSSVPRAALESRSPGRAALLAGIDAYNRHRPDALLQAKADFETAIGQDGMLARAHAGLALTSLELVEWRIGSRAENEATARRAAARAKALDPVLPEALVASAEVAAWLDSRWADADDDLRAALRADPASVAALRAQSGILAARGRLDEAIGAADRASALEPRNVSLQVRAGRLRYYAGRPDEAIARLERTVAFDPGDPDARKSLSDAYWQRGLAARAAVEHEAWLARLGIGAPELERVHRAIVRGGLPALWRENAKRAAGASDAVAYKVAGFHALAGDPDSALPWLERALRNSDRNLVFLAIDPDFDRVRPARGYAQLEARVQQVFRLADVPPPGRFAQARVDARPGA
jgi:tetratricopeptide (TPR) repeat protein